MVESAPHFGSIKSELPKPNVIRDAQTSFRLNDIDGDGFPEIVVQGKGLNGFFSRLPNGNWLNFRNFDKFPNIDLNDANVRFMDLTGDGLADIVISKGDYFDIYFSEGREGYSQFRRVHCGDSHGSAPKIVFSDYSRRIFLADMSGDGLTDIVRITNQGIVYWPNIGYGKFGEKIIMGNPPLLDSADQFDTRYVHLVDVDGTGTADLLYISKGAVRYYKNLSGNAWQEEPLPAALAVNATPQTFIQTVDLLGNGTQCIVVSSSLPTQDNKLRYWELTSGIKPFLLSQINNNMGAITKLHYCSSTKFYMQDKFGSRKQNAEGRKAANPWITKLPFPVHVLEKVETIDLVANKHFTNRYAYHHGYFDPKEREFRGFGMVEQWDTELYSPPFMEGCPKGGVVDDGMEGWQPLADGLNSPPIYTKTWFHTGHYRPSSPSSPYKKEYWNQDPNAWELPNAPLPEGLSAEETREALRALRGSILRTEVYNSPSNFEGVDGEAGRGSLYSIEGVDGEAGQGSLYSIEGVDGEAGQGSLIPYTIEEKSYHLQCLQKKNKNHHAIFLKTDSESLLYHYERNTADPRILHKLTLETDLYGNPTKTAEIAYPRKISNSVEQNRILATYTENNYINKPQNAERHIGLLYQTKKYQLHNLPYTGNKFEITTLLLQITQAQEIDYATPPTEPGLLSVVEARPIHHSRTLFWNTPQTAALPLGQTAPQALPYQQQSLELTPGVIDHFNTNGNQPLPAQILQDTCKYLQEGNNWFAVTDIQHFDPEKFYLPDTTTDPFDNVTTIEYDEYNLFPVKVTDPLGFEITAEYDYRVLQPQKLTDPNGNNKELKFNTLGLVTSLTLTEKNGEEAVDNPNLEAPLQPGGEIEPPNLEEGHPQYDDVLATEIYDYNLHAWQDNQKPVYAYIAKRETHNNINTRWIESYIYTDGLGNQIMTKTTAQDGDAWHLDPVTGNASLVTTHTRWLASGKTIYNNKGLPVKQYEPWYSNTHNFTFEEELTHYGVTPIMHYDPLGRLIQTDFPDGTTTRVAFDAWQQKNYDQNDCDESSPHYNTPQIIDFDVLGRPFQTTDTIDSPPLAAAGGGSGRTTRHALDITGRILTTTDALGRLATQNIYALSEKHLIYTGNIDSGERWMLNNTTGKPALKIDNRQHLFFYLYDELQRRTKTILFDDSNSPTVPDVKITELITYGTDDTTNSIGQIAKICAQDGITNFEYDFKGNIILSRKQFTTDYNMITNWDETVELQEEEFLTQTAYDALNRPIAIVHPDNSVIGYEYDKGGLLQKVFQDATEHVTNITYNPKGQRENIYYGNNTKTRYYYNPLNFRLTRLLTTRNIGQDILQDLNYDYDAVGNIIEIRDDAQQTIYFNNQVIAPIANFEYDALYRLTKATGRELTALTAPNENDFVNNIPCPNNASNAMQNYVHNYEYDLLGNILSDAWKTYQYDTECNFLLGNDNIANQFTYDLHGNMLTMPHLSSMVWDSEDRLFSAGNGTFTSFYNYDAEGNRTRKVVEKGNIVETRYYIGGYEVFRKHVNDTLDFERSSISIYDIKTVKQEKDKNKDYVTPKYEIDNTRRIVLTEIKTIENGQSLFTPETNMRYQYSNHLGSACLELDEMGSIISYEEYHPFGTTSYRSGNNETEVSLKRYKYCGKEKDEETGLYYFGARFYADWICRFCSVDVMQFKYSELSPFVYCANNPIKLIDPDGRKIVIAGSDEFKKTAFKDMQKLSSKNLVMLKDGSVVEASKYKGDKSNIAQSGTGSGDKAHGTKLVSEVINSKHTVTLKYRSGEDNEFKPTSDLNAKTPSVGSGGTLYYDPETTGYNIVNADGTTGSPAFISLGHELDHAGRAVEGKLLDTNKENGKYDPDSPPNWPTKISPEEIQTRKNENIIRNENHVKPRAIPN